MMHKMNVTDFVIYCDQNCDKLLSGRQLLLWPDKGHADQEEECSHCITIYTGAGQVCPLNSC